MAFGGFQRGPYQTNYQQVAEEEPWRVVLFPPEAGCIRSKLDRALYMLAKVAQFNAPQYRMPSYAPKRVRRPVYTSLLSDFAADGLRL